MTELFAMLAAEVEKMKALGQDIEKLLYRVHFETGDGQQLLAGFFFKDGNFISADYYGDPPKDDKK